MPLPYTPDRELNEPDDDKPTCEVCGKECYSSELELIYINLKPTQVCEDCETELNK